MRCVELRYAFKRKLPILVIPSSCFKIYFAKQYNKWSYGVWITVFSLSFPWSCLYLPTSHFTPFTIFNDLRSNTFESFPSLSLQFKHKLWHNYSKKTSKNKNLKSLKHKKTKKALILSIETIKINIKIKDIENKYKNKIREN